MKNNSHWLLAAIAVLCAASVASIAFARGGGHHGGMRGGVGTLCSGAAMLDLSLTNIDIMIRLNDAQKAALGPLKKIARENSENMSRVCEGGTPASVPAKLDAAEKRLETTLAGVRSLKAAANKFYAALSEEQKTQADNLLDWPGL